MGLKKWVGKTVQGFPCRARTSQHEEQSPQLTVPCLQHASCSSWFPKSLCVMSAGSVSVPASHPKDPAAPQKTSREAAGAAPRALLCLDFGPHRSPFPKQPQKAKCSRQQQATTHPPAWGCSPKGHGCTPNLLGAKNPHQRGAEPHRASSG